MGNTCCNCFHAQSNTAMLIDLRRKIIRRVDVPVTAAELMLEEAGHVVSPMDDFRLSAMKADEILSRNKVYVLIPVSRVNGKLSESEMAVIKSVCGGKKAKRRSSKVIPVVTEICGDGTENRVKSLGEEGSDIGILINRTRQWKPDLEPIHEEI